MNRIELRLRKLETTAANQLCPHCVTMRAPIILFGDAPVPSDSHHCSHCGRTWRRDVIRIGYGDRRVDTTPRGDDELASELAQ